MKNIMLLSLCINTMSLFAQDKKTEFDAAGWNAPYSLPLEGWTIERFLIPIDFAPGIKYSGVEDLRFTQGWGDVKSSEYWSYAFLWYLEGKHEMTAEIIDSNLTMYYSGLVGRNIKERKIPAEKVIPVKVSMNKITTIAGDLATFSGTIQMLDYMQQQPVILNCITHHRTCPDQNKTYIFYEISPKAPADVIWQRFNKLWADFDCSNPKAK